MLRRETTTISDDRQLHLHVAEQPTDGRPRQCSVEGARKPLLVGGNRG